MKESRFSEEGSLDRFENKLFNPKVKISDVPQHHNLHNVETNELPTSWSDNNPGLATRKSSGWSFGFSFLVLSLGVLLFAAIFASWNILQKRNVVSSENIDVVLQVKPYLEGGEASPLSIIIQNRNNVTLVDSEAVISYEKGSGGENQKEKINNKIKFGEIKQNEMKRNDQSIQLYGSEGESRSIKVEFNYKVAGSGGVFSKVVAVDVILKTPPVAIHVDGPERIASSQVSKYVISVRNNNSKISGNVLVKAILPANFTVLSVVPENKTGGINTWAFSGLRQGEDRTITIEGSAKALIGEHLIIKTQVGSQVGNSNDIGTVYSFDLKDVTISGGDLKFSFKTETDNGKVSSLRFGNKAKISLNYENISGRSIDSAEIKMVFSGDAFDAGSIATQNGEYSINNKTVLWNKFTLPELINLPAGAKGSLYVTFDIPQTGNDKSFVRLDVQGGGVGSDSAIRDIKTNISQTWKIQGETSLSSQVIYVGSSFINSGPVPPLVGILTNYTIRLDVSSHKLLKEGTVSFNLPSYVTWLDKVVSDGSVAYYPSTRTVIWKIGALGGGDIGSMEAQIAFTPAQSHFGTIPNLTSGINFSFPDKPATEFPLKFIYVMGFMKKTFLPETCTDMT